MREMWLVTDPKAERAYGTVVASDQTQACERVDEGYAQWFWRAEPDPRAPLSVHLPFTLADGRWRELGVTTPGGDVLPEQVEESVSRRFALVNSDGTWSVITLTWFVVDYGDSYTDDRHQAVRLECRAEYDICSDVHAVPDSSFWEEVRYQVIDAKVDATQWQACTTAAAAAFDPADIDWDGRQF